MGMCVQSSCKYLQWIHASFQKWRDVFALVLLFIYVEIIDTWSGFGILVTLNQQKFPKGEGIPSWYLLRLSS